MLLDNYMTKNEQKILYFVLIGALIGLLVQYKGIHAEDEAEIELIQKALSEPGTVLYDINTVTKAELQTIPGIGEVRANAIIEFRDANRPITFDQLIAVRGVGEKTLQTLRGYFVDSDQQISMKQTEITRSSQKLLDGSAKTNINDALLSDLMKVKGVGKVKGESILSFLQENGRIKNIDQLLEIKGIGKSTLINIEELFYADTDQ